ncbi:MAG: hypothetical protein JJU19_09920 [Pararhodobacter sp.]|nr:hypothetical protein [Pararhodobacter sp.]
MGERHELDWAMQFCGSEQRILLIDPNAGASVVPMAPLRAIGKGATVTATVAEPAAVTPALLQQIRPDLVVTPLIGPRWDALDTGVALTNAGYTAKLMILMPKLPRQALVLRELRILCPSLDIIVADLPEA